MIFSCKRQFTNSSHPYNKHVRWWDKCFYSFQLLNAVNWSFKTVRYWVMSPSQFMGNLNLNSDIPFLFCQCFHKNNLIYISQCYYNNKTTTNGIGRILKTDFLLIQSRTPAFNSISIMFQVISFIRTGHEKSLSHICSVMASYH